MAHLRRPVPKIGWAANPPGSLDLTNFLRSVASDSTGEATVAETRRRAGLEESERERDFERENERVFGFCEIWEEKESEDNEEVSEEIEIDILIWVWSFSEGQGTLVTVVVYRRKLARGSIWAGETGRRG